MKLNHFFYFKNFISSMVLLALQPLFAAPALIEIRIKDHLFIPDTISVPANQKVKLLVINEDPTPEEFESYELNREKIIAGNSKAIIFIGPLSPGVYPFFGEFNPKTALGKITAE